MEDAQPLVTEFVAHYNEVRSQNAICYVAPVAKLAGRAQATLTAWDRKLDAARQRRKAAGAASRPAG